MRRDVPVQRVYRELAELWYVATHEDLWRSAAQEQAADLDYPTEKYEALERQANLARCQVRWWREPVLNYRVQRNLAKDGVKI
jgi:hypothetical protein